LNILMLLPNTSIADTPLPAQPPLKNNRRVPVYTALLVKQPEQ
jgi:hypothetical protein